MARASKLLVAFVAVSAMAAAPSRAATLELSPASSTIGVGDWIHVFVSGTGFTAGTDGGDFALFWSPNLDFVGLTVETATWDVSAVDARDAVSGYVGSVDVFASTGTPGLSGASFPIARLTLRATAEGAAVVTLGSDRVGWSLDGGSLDYAPGPDAEIEVSGVPEPDVAGALAAGAFLLAATARLRRTAHC